MAQAAILKSPRVPEAKAIECRAQIVQCLKENKEILVDDIPAEHHQAFFEEPEKVPIDTLLEVITNLEKP